MCKVAIPEFPETLPYGFPDPHPLSSERAHRFHQKLDVSKIDMNLEIFQSSHLDESQLSLFHEKDYIDFVKGKSAYGEGYLDGGDTPCYRGVHESSTRVVNDTLSCASKIIEGLAEHGFNPSGGLHHAFPNRAAGFCVFNDIGVLINFIRSHYKLRRILYIDIDAHHGDGVYYPFESDPDVLILDIHEDGKFLFPGTGGPEERGKGAASGTKRNICLPPGAPGDTLIDAMDKSEDYLRESSAEFVILQCGADGLEGDPITHLMYSPDAYDEVIQRVHEISHRICSGKLLLLGGGGYDIENASSAWLRAVKTVLFER